MRRRSHLYIEWKCAEDEAMPSSEAKPMRTHHLSKALNAQRLEEFLVNNFPAPLKNITIIRQQKRKLHNPSVYKVTEIWSRGATDEDKKRD